VDRSFRSACPSLVGPGEGVCVGGHAKPCARVRTKKIFTSPYAPQTEGMVDRFNGKLCRDLAKFVTHEEDWDRHLAFAVFRYKASCNEATGLSPFRALFGEDLLIMMPVWVWSYA
jgi:transposase InsO family protein